MEIYILDDLLRRIEVIDEFVSMIWTERWRDSGDFELQIQATPAMKTLLVSGKQLVITESDRVMEIEFAEDAVDDEGKKLLKITGPSLEDILKRRVAMNGLTGPTPSNDWTITGTPGDIARWVFRKICREGMLSPSDVIPFLKEGSLYPVGSIGEDTVVRTVDIKIDTVFKVIKDICDQYDLGFRIVRNQDESELYFDIYAGNNLTTQQSSSPAVIFSPDLENMKNTTEVNSIKDYANVAYVFSKNGSRIVYADNADATTAGFQRRIVMVDAGVDDPAGQALQDILLAKGLEELAKHRPLMAFDGEVDQYSDYKYGRDYNLGDLVEMRSGDGSINEMRVTEQIFVSDAQGDRSYPTLAVESYITPGSWDSWGNDTWDGGGEDTWDE